MYTTDNNYLKKVTDSAGAVTQYTYNTAKGLVTKITDPNGNETVYEYDPNNDRLLSVSNPSTSAETEFAYNASGQTTQISNSDVAYNLSYDSFGRPTDVKIKNTTLSTNSYNADNQLADTVYGNGDSVEYAYNEDNLLSSVKYDGALSYEYYYTSQNQVGRLVDHDNDVTWEYSYDMAGRLTDVESDNGKKIEYGYDSKGNPGSITVKDGTSTLSDIGYTYDSQNRPSAVTVNSMAGQPKQSYVYDSLGRIVSYENTFNSANPQNKINRSFSYLTNGGYQTNRIEELTYTQTTSSGTSTYVAGYGYEYDDNGNITHIYFDDELQNRYYYDALNRLYREDRVSYNKTFVYTYDKNGDILNKKEYAYTTAALGTPTATINYEYGDSDCPNGLTSYNGETVTYDANGNPLTYRGYTMTWEKGRQLASMSKGGITTTFKYDASGMRTEKTQGNYKIEYTYVGEKLVSMKAGDNVMNFAYGADGSPYSFTYNGTTYFYLLNLQGDVIGIYDASGSVITRYTYDAWGKLITLHTSNGTIALSNPLRYRGYVYDRDTELYYLQSRYYDPDTGRFINADSLLVAGDYLQGTNMFAYCLNNPVNYTDPSGKAISNLTSSELLAVNISTIIVCMACIAEYAEKNGKDINAFYDFWYRTECDKANLTQISEILTVGLYVLVGGEWLDTLLSAKGIYGDVKDVVKVALGGTVKPGVISGIIGAAANILMDFYNPLMFDDDVRLNAPIHIANAAAGVGIGMFTVELVATVTGLTGNPWVGAAVGTLFVGIVAFSGI